MIVARLNSDGTLSELGEANVIHPVHEAQGYSLVDNDYYELLNGTYATYYNKDGSIDWDKENSLIQESLITKYKSYYLELVNEKLKELDYDSIERLGIYAANPKSIYYEESLSLIEWHENLVNKNYEIVNSIKEGTMQVPSKEEYLSMLPTYEEVQE